jgi:hypothetical protein
MVNLIQVIAPCDQGASCRNSTIVCGFALSKCAVCRLAPNNEDLENQYWSGIAGAKHPILEREKKDKQQIAIREKQLKRLNKDHSKTKLLKRAAKAEKKTEEAIIKSTVNSGRLNRDGDHIIADSITLDTKLQTNRQHPHVDLRELDKVGEDARRAGTMFGALVIRTSNNVGVVVMKEEDFGRLIDQWRKHV